MDQYTRRELKEMMSAEYPRKGSVLILSLWLLLLLTVFSINIGLRIRQRVELVNRIESRMRLHHLAQAGIKKGISVLKHCLSLADNQYSAYTKNYMRNNIEKFKDLKIGEGRVNVRYYEYTLNYNDSRLFYGFVDEESKININYADRGILQRLILAVVTNDEEDALDLADAIIDWRTFGKSRIDGFASDDYYSHLEYPYEKKDAPYELLDELLLVEGMTPEIYNQLKPFITIYGDGAININTASRIVLKALGLSEDLLDKLITVRRGPDGLEATLDDYVFLKLFDIASEMSNAVDITEKEAREIDALNTRGIIKTNSSFYFIESLGKLMGRKGQLKASCVFDANANRIIYYKENN